MKLKVPPQYEEIMLIKGNQDIPVEMCFARVNLSTTNVVVYMIFSTHVHKRMIDIYYPMR